MECTTILLREEIVRLECELYATKCALKHKESLLDKMQEMALMNTNTRGPLKPETVARREFYKKYKDSPEVLEKLKSLIGDKPLHAPTIKRFTDILFLSQK